MKRYYFLVLSLALALPLGAKPAAAAEYEADARIYCEDENPGQPKRVERCVRGQLKAAGLVGTLLQEHADEAEVKQIYARCVREIRKSANAVNWVYINGCMNREIKQFNSFKRATEGIKDNEFLRKIVGFCREKLEREDRMTYYSLDQCRKMQTKAGYGVADIYREIEEGAPERFAIDDCAEKHRTDTGYYDWQRVHTCAKYARRRQRR